MAGPLALIADIGGTNVRFALVAPDGAIGEALRMRCADYAGPAEAAEAFLAAASPAAAPTRAAFAVASPIAGDQVDLTNSSWRFSIEATRRRLGLERFSVVNDFTAVALSVRHLGGDDLVRLGGGAAAPVAPIAVLGPGTGLGVSALVPSPAGEWVALAAEGGHVTMAAADDHEAELLSVLRRRLGHVSAERVLSGPGLVNLYEAVAAVRGRPAAYTTPDAISQRGLDGSCAVCAETLDTFFAMLGTVTGNLVLSVGARGGAFIAGGILPRMADAFQRSGFRARFEDKGRFQSYLAPIPVWLVVHPQPAFIGLASLVRT
ncbi:glucokinase [Magnetospirillum sp. UT-4]|uniref:glucokinase n=1 Tax=Magnetospirillum sp. UT-4 TaxID=2681467 RepID=UPI0013862495|nr:glucokinase [Magnetospirillum sp. UT-4]CAA7623167.1 Glucokinase [Magnetospirillum sp. UT-4]